MKLIMRVGMVGLVAAVAAGAGCDRMKVPKEVKAASLTLKAGRTVAVVGQTVQLTVKTREMPPGAKVTWVVSPRAPGVLTPDPAAPIFRATFVSRQPGQLNIRATARTPGGGTVSDETNIAVTGPMGG